MVFPETAPTLRSVTTAFWLEITSLIIAVLAGRGGGNVVPKGTTVFTSWSPLSSNKIVQVSPRWLNAAACS